MKTRSHKAFSQAITQRYSLRGCSVKVTNDTVYLLCKWMIYHVNVKRMVSSSAFTWSLSTLSSRNPLIEHELCLPLLSDIWISAVILAKYNAGLPIHLMPSYRDKYWSNTHAHKNTQHAGECQLSGQCSCSVQGSLRGSRVIRMQPSPRVHFNPSCAISLQYSCHGNPDDGSPQTIVGLR